MDQPVNDFILYLSSCLRFPYLLVERAGEAHQTKCSHARNRPHVNFPTPFCETAPFRPLSRSLKHLSQHILVFLRLGFALGFGEGIHLRRAISKLRKAKSELAKGRAKSLFIGK